MMAFSCSMEDLRNRKSIFMGGIPNSKSGDLHSAGFNPEGSFTVHLFGYLRVKEATVARTESDGRLSAFARSTHGLREAGISSGQQFWSELAVLGINGL